MTKYKN
jgi:hypothetical protein